MSRTLFALAALVLGVLGTTGCQSVQCTSGNCSTDLASVQNATLITPDVESEWMLADGTSVNPDAAPQFDVVQASYNTRSSGCSCNGCRSRRGLRASSCTGCGNSACNSCRGGGRGAHGHIDGMCNCGRYGIATRGGACMRCGLARGGLCSGCGRFGVLGGRCNACGLGGFGPNSGAATPHTPPFMGPYGPMSGQVAYPYYTTRGPRDFLMGQPLPLGR